MKSIAHAVYSPPFKGLPFLAVTLLPDGTVIARQFETEDAAVKFNTERAAVREFRGITH